MIIGVLLLRTPSYTTVSTDAANTIMIALENHTKKSEKIIYRKDALIMLYRRRMIEIAETPTDTLM